ncbi:hypothetical protein UlMin_020054 [Ulmus minor]
MTTPDAIIDIDPTPLGDDKVLIEELEAEMKNTSSEQPNSSVTKIQNVPRFMFQQRNIEKDYYTPREMPIGPIYANEETDKQRQIKVKFAAQFIKTSGKNCHELLKSIKNEIETLRTRFDENLLADFDNDKLARMLLLDGCSVLQFIRSRVRDELKKFQINNGQASVIDQDLFLMTNQIPFQVLEILMDSLQVDAAVNRNALESSIDNFIKINLMMPYTYVTGNYRNFYKATNEVPLHLLHILQSALLYGFVKTRQNQNRQDQNLLRPLLHILRSALPCVFDKFCHNNSGDDSDSMEEFKKEYFRNIQDLKTAGIKLSSSASSCLRDVTFSPCSIWLRARLKLPQLIVNDSTGRKLWNLVAYEMCPDNHNSEYGVTSYLSFLDSLIDSEEDVKDLRSACILRNHLSSDTEVANLFNEIGYYVVSDKTYSKVKWKIQRYCDSSWSKIVAPLLDGYFKNYWSFIALLGAMAALGLTAAQTYYAVKASADPPSHPPQ